MATWDLTKTRHHLFICNGSSCNKAGAEELTQAVRKEISSHGADEIIHTSRTLCNGRCQDKCVLITYPEGYWYKDMTRDDASELINALLEGRFMNEKISHSFTGGSFERTEGTIIGIEKDRELVEKVSKKHQCCIYKNTIS
ncbi:(2Fe-2S) ferredoxin domain-containing protein [Evansella halocellulosilytica]|uniref:(2Fe-2S) ferredoxin domain-containing protein n=1 Tax=Evansella halocellulosilytica TaxID=2011013 RepID=UPI000BB7502A|nr:(2Fe-2S) ferredoxin domain-containing protein [Evansella halocellulosilytica]